MIILLRKSLPKKAIVMMPGTSTHDHNQFILMEFKETIQALERYRYLLEMQLPSNLVRVAYEKQENKKQIEYLKNIVYTIQKLHILDEPITNDQWSHYIRIAISISRGKLEKENIDKQQTPVPPSFPKD